MKYTKIWTERHEFSASADSEKEFEAMCEASEPEITRLSTTHESMTEYCESHRQEISEDNPCFSCRREQAEEKSYEQSKENV